jgi:hypothetical protein
MGCAEIGFNVVDFFALLRIETSEHGNEFWGS